MTLLMSYVPVITAWYAKRLDGDSRIHHAPSTPLEVRERTDCMQYAHFKTIYITNLIVHVYPSTILEPVIQTCAWWFRERY